MNSMLYNWLSLTSLDLSNFVTSDLTNAENMFKNCKSLNHLNISKFNTENLNNINYMFYNCSSLTSLDLSNFNIVNEVKMNYLFYYCSNLQFIDISNIKNISGSNNTLFGNDIPATGQIKVNINIMDIIKEQLPKNWEILVWLLL